MNYKGITGSKETPWGKTWANSFVRVLDFIHEARNNRMYVTFGVWETETDYNNNPNTFAFQDSFEIKDGSNDQTYDIISVDAQNKQIVVAGDKRKNFFSDAKFYAIKDGETDVEFTVASSSYSTNTTITVDEAVSIDNTWDAEVVKHYTNNFSTSKLNEINVNHKTQTYDYMLQNISTFSSFTGVAE